MSRTAFETVVIIGLGLIGSSLARAIRHNGLAAKLIGYDANEMVRQRATELQLTDMMAFDMVQAVQSADLVVLCIPVGAYAAVGEQIKDHLKKGAIVSDVGSVKGAVFQALQPLLASDVHLIPAHPVAGTEYSGPDAGFATLFKDRWCIVTPPESVNADALKQVVRLWEGVGSKVETMTAQHHDLVLAITSHVPHLIAYNIVGTAADLEEVTQSEVIKFSAGGFRDFTRIAASDPTMWRDIFLNNREAVLEMLGRFNEDLSALARAIRWEDGDALFNLFTRTRAIRRGVVEQGQD